MNHAGVSCRVRRLVIAVAAVLVTSITAPAVAASAVAAPAVAASATTDPAAPPSAPACGTPAPGRAACLALMQVAPAEPAVLTATPAVTPAAPPLTSAAATPAGYGPADLRSAYALTGTGSAGETVAVVAAYDDPAAEPDLGRYRAQYGLGSCTSADGCFRKLDEKGYTAPLPGADPHWATEVSLDLDVVSAICPRCHLLLVEADSPAIADLGQSVNSAVRHGARFVVNGYGAPESSSTTSQDSAFFRHPGVVLTAGTGDADYTGALFPATGRSVTAVGGTTLVRSAGARGWDETVWNSAPGTGTGSGCSQYVPQPAVQAALGTGCSMRAEADVSAVADPGTGVAVYQSYGGSGWGVGGGTSIAAALIAGVYALAGVPGPTDSPNTYAYARPGHLNDVTSGTNGTCTAPLCRAGAGWDGPTGLGTPSGLIAFGTHALGRAWGYSGEGELGNGRSTGSSTPVQVSGLNGVTAIASRALAGYALTTDGRVHAWGSNDHGQLGNGSSVDSSTPVTVSGLDGVTAVAAGRSSGYALTSDGRVHAWGDNDHGQLGNGSSVDSSTPVTVGGLRDVTAIAGGYDDAYALTADGHVYAWGYNAYGSLGNASTAGYSTRPVQVSDLAGVTAIAGGGFGGYALSSDGLVHSWGDNTYGELGDGTTTSSATPVVVDGLTGVTAIAGGYASGFARTSDGLLHAWGSNASGQLGDGTRNDARRPVLVSGLSGVTSVAGGYQDGFARTTSGRVYAWGANSYGQLGNGVTRDSAVPVQVRGLGGVSAVAGGEFSGYAIT